MKQQFDCYIVYIYTPHLMKNVTIPDEMSYGIGEQKELLRTDIST